MICAFCGGALGIALGALLGYGAGASGQPRFAYHHYYDHGGDDGDDDDDADAPHTPKTPATEFRYN